MIREMLSTDGAESLLAREREPTRYREVQIMNRESLRVALATVLHSSVDRRSLHESDLVPHQHRWVNEATGLLSGANYIGAVKVRGNLLPSAVRVARGRPHMCPMWRLSAAWITGSHLASVPEDSCFETCQT